jgi:farnesyl-diphosphate farnesyltransferase
MSRESFQTQPVASDAGYQEQILPHVSRTFALTIPQLPVGLRGAVTNAYLLCRIADTVEDEPAVSAAETYAYLQRFAAVVDGTEPAAPLAREVHARLSEQTLPAERDLVQHMERVIRVTAQLDPRQRAAIRRCIELMCRGMHQFQRTASLRGLDRASDLDSYCYYVAGVVGEMLTELFCGYSAEAARHRALLRELAPSFAQGLQMTNILKDVWEDRSRGACWLPREVFARHGFELERLTPERYDARFGAGLKELIGVAHGHLRNAMSFTLLIPAAETGIRRFCLWAIGLAVLTLREIHHNPRFVTGSQVKVSHAAVAAVRLLTSVAVRRDAALQLLFDWAASGLPLAAPADVRRGSGAAAAAAQLPAPATEYAGDLFRASMSRPRRTSDGSSIP